MIDWLVNRFVKDASNVENQQVRTRYGVLSSIVGLVLNSILFGIKLSIGLVINSISVLADAFNNLSDAASSIISLVGVKLANRPADKEHPFGHGRYEYIAALLVAFLVLQVGFSCFKSSFTKILHPEMIQSQPVLLIILCLSILLKVWLGVFNRKLGKKIHSTVMMATAADSFGDVLITLVTVLSVFIGTMTGWMIDGYMGLIVSIVVLIAGVNIAKDTLEPLLGEAVSKEDYDRITKFVESYDGITGSHDLIIHKYGPSNIMATIHGEVPKDMNMESAHEMIDKIERDARKILGIFLVIHMDPITVNDEFVINLKKLIGGIASNLEPEASIHDFRMVNGENQINLIFDLVVPYSYNEEKEAILMEKMIAAIHEMDTRYQCVVTIEHSFIST